MTLKTEIKRKLQKLIFKIHIDKIGRRRVKMSISASKGKKQRSISELRYCLLIDVSIIWLALPRSTAT